MNNRLWVHDDLDVLGCQTEQPVCLDDLQSLIHQCRRIDGHFPSHAPVRMAKGFLHGDTPEILFGRIQEGAAGRCQENSRDITRAFPREALKNGAVLTVDGDETDPVFADQPHDIRTGSNKSFLVREGNPFPMADCLRRWFYTREPDERRYDNIRVVSSGDLQDAVLAGENLNR